MTPLGAALLYAALGWPVLPLHTPTDGVCDCPRRADCPKPGKDPRTLHGLDDATTDERSIRRWWTIWPQANVAIDLARSGLVDIAPDGVEWWSEFTARGLPPTLRFASGGGNGHEHHLYARTKECPIYRLTEAGKYDVLSAGYAVMPPSVHASGLIYTWLEPSEDGLIAVPTTPQPKWALDMLQAKHRRSVNGTPHEPARDPNAPPVALRGQALERWYGRDYDRNPETGVLDRSHSLWSIAVVLLEAGCSPAFTEQLLAERDVALGWEKFTKRGDAPLRYRVITEHARAGQGPKRVRLNKRVAIGDRVSVVDDEPDEPDEPVRLGYVPDFPVEVLPDLLQDLIKVSSLPTNLLAGAYLGACAAAIGGQVQAYHHSFSERAILFIALLAMTGAGKSPALRQAFAPIAAWDIEKHRAYRTELDIWRNRTAEQKKNDKASNIAPPLDHTILCNLATPEAIYRRLDAQSSLGLTYDELASFLKGLSRYRNRGDEDTDSALIMWEGAPLRYTRVGQGGGGGNAIDIYIPEPTVTICGGLQPYRQELLGQDLEGLRPRWLVFLHDGLGDGRIVLPKLDDTERYTRLISTLLEQRSICRRWEIPADAWAYLNKLGQAWDARLREADDLPSATAALPKATRHCVRLALVLAELNRVFTGLPPNDDPLLGGGYLEKAAQIVDYSLAVWNALGGGKSVAMSFRAAVADQAIPKIEEYLARKGGGPLNANVLRNNNVAGITTKADLDAILARYEAHYPGTITYERGGSTIGRRKRIIHLPTRGKKPVV